MKCICLQLVTGKGNGYFISTKEMATSCRNGYFMSAKMKIRSNKYEHLGVQTPAATDGAVKAFEVATSSL